MLLRRNGPAVRVDAAGARHVVVAGRLRAVRQVQAEERDQLIVDALEEAPHADNRRVLELVLEAESERARALDAQVRRIRRPASGANVRSGGSHGPGALVARNSSAPGASMRCATSVTTRVPRSGSTAHRRRGLSRSPRCR